MSFFRGKRGFRCSVMFFNEKCHIMMPKERKNNDVWCRPVLSSPGFLCVRVSFYLSRGWKSTINNFIIMPPWLHMYTEPRSINHDSQCVCTVCGVLSMCVMQGYLYLCGFLCVFEKVFVFHCVVHLSAARGSVCLLDCWTMGVLFTAWWRVTDECL